MCNPRFGYPALIALLLSLWTAGCGGPSAVAVDELLRVAGIVPQTPDQATVVAGLREALRIGTQRTVQTTARENGYFGNPLIHIPIPGEVEAATDGLRAVGLGRMVDDLELAMNRAAERAAAEATPVFVAAITQLTFADAFAILEGSERAATDYFEGRTRDELFARFSPIVDAGMREVGLVQLYDRFVAEISRLPFLPRPQVDLRAYVTDRGLDGLFVVLAQEEARIRRDPAARTTQLLRRVFGGG